MIRLSGYIKPFKSGVLSAIILLFGQAMCDLNLPNLMSSIVNIGIQQGQTGHIFRIGVVMLIVAFLGGGANILVNLLSVKISAGVARKLRRDLFSKVESFLSSEFDEFSAASLITRCTNDVTQVQQLIMMGIRMACYAPIMAAGGIIMALQKSVSMSWIIALAVIIVICIVTLVMSMALPKFKVIQKQIDRLNLVSREHLSGLMVIRAFGTQDHEKDRFDTANAELTKTSLFVNRIMVFMMPSMMLVMNGAALLSIWVGGHYIAESSMMVGDMMAFMQYAMQVIMSFLMLSMMSIMLPRASVSAQRIADVLYVENSIKDPVEPVSFEGGPGVVEFKDVSFRYLGAQENAVCGISFTAHPGETTAVIGATGSGKSTIANLILRFYDPCDGEILLDGVNIKNVKQSDLRSRIGYVPQKSMLLYGTIDSNIRYGKKSASAEEIEKAAAIAQAFDFINEKPQGFQEEVSQGGANVSGGQKQRISIARALVRKPDILIFDDSFSALDFRTDAALRKALKEFTENSTVIVIAQRIGTIMNAEQILVLDEGRIIGKGTHSELMKTCDEYREIARSQLASEDRA